MATTPSSSQKWGPSEWFGLEVANAADADRLSLATDALLPSKASGRDCPYLSATTGKPATCAKAGGVCSVQLYQPTPSGIQLTGGKVAICPARLVSKDVLRSIASEVLEVAAGNPVSLVKEVPYSLNLTKTKKGGDPIAAGRIDWLLVDGSDAKRFVAVETQAVYMSGKSQDGTFQAFVSANGALTMPPDVRHPDYKSSVPKRLAPQLESKARHLSSTSRKTVVIVDEFVKSNMSNLAEVDVPVAYRHNPVRAAQHKLNSCEVVMAIVGLTPIGPAPGGTSGGLALRELLFCKIDAVKAALDAVAPMSNIEFEQVVLDLVTAKKGGKVFPL